jgi:hypothetical protein
MYLYCYLKIFFSFARDLRGLLALLRRGVPHPAGRLSRGCISSTKSAHEQGPEDRRASSQQSMKVLLGAARWYIGGGGKVRLVGRGLRRVR